ncbi:UDP-N-acetylmuramoyl-L-alanine--D-glutamate ligase [Anaerolineales bacterium]
MQAHDTLYQKHVLIVGFARQGIALTRWLTSIGAILTVTDARKSTDILEPLEQFPDVNFVLGEHPLSLLDNIDLICVSGGVPLDLPLLKEAKYRQIPLTNDAQLFLERSPAPVIGITGSAGKTTTTALVAHILRHAEYTVWMGGNIGNVLLDNLDEIKPDDVVVMELSSFQLELMHISPRIAALLNLTPNHLDRHGTMEAYTTAKANIMLHQSAQDVFVLNHDDIIVHALEPYAAAECVWFSKSRLLPSGAFMTGSRLTIAGAASWDNLPHVLMDKSEIPLRGEHNLMNVLAACAITGALGLAIDRPGLDPDILVQAIKTFQSVPHRLQPIRTLNQVTYINDSIATAPERMLAALTSFEEPLVLLLGGADKDLPWQSAIPFILARSRYVIVFGHEGPKQVRSIVPPLFEQAHADLSKIIVVDTLNDAVRIASEKAQPGDVVLLSPGGTSYDAYKDFEERGQHFTRLVQELSEN